MEKNGVKYDNRLFISDRAHVVTNMQMEADKSSELDKSKTFIGTTKKGIGPTYASKMNRYGLRIGDLYNWDNFVTKYNYMYKIYQEKENLKLDTESEIK